MNLKSLARDLGISKTTVSRALNGFPEVNVRTRERVLAAAKAAGYEANPMARSLAVGRTNIFGMISPLLPGDPGDALLHGVVTGMSAVLEQSNRNLIIAPVSPGNELASYEHMVRGRRVDGLVVSRTLVHDERIDYLVKSGFPFVTYGRTATQAPYAWFDYDHEAGMRLATGHLLAHGHQRIGLISAPLELHCAFERRNSFMACMESAGLAPDPRHLLAGSIERRSGYQAMCDLLACSPRPTAVIVDNHLSGAGAVRALLDAGVRVGAEVSVIVWGSIEDSLIGVDIATIDLPHAHRAGATMIAMLSALVEGAAPSLLHELWQPVLLPGVTAGRCAG